MAGGPDPAEVALRNLLKILFAGFVAFMAIAVAQEWGYFSSIWFGANEESRVVEQKDGSPAAGKTVHELLTLMRHLYTSGGDPRFADRMPASDDVIEEMLGDIAFLKHDHRLQDPRLVRAEILDVRALGQDRAEVLTKEYWIFRVLRMSDRSEAEPARSVIFLGRYNVQREGSAWRVHAWDIAEPRADGKAPRGG